MNDLFQLENEGKETVEVPELPEVDLPPTENPAPAAKKAAPRPDVVKKHATSARKGVIRIEYKDNRDLYQSFMPVVEGCGLFYPTDVEYPLYPAGGKDSEVFVMIKLPEEERQHSFAGRVIWLNPKKQVMKRVPGVGIQLTGKGVSEFRELIESKIGKMLQTGLPTMTL